MLVKELINEKPEPLQRQSTMQEAVIRMESENMRFYPIVDESNNQLVGQASLDDIQNYHVSGPGVVDTGAGVGEVLRLNDHILQAVQHMLRSDRQVMPVIDHEGGYAGLVQRSTLINAVMELMNLGDPGTIIMIEMMPRDFMLSDIIRIIESEGARVLSMTVQSPDALSEHYRVSVKLNLDDLSRVGNALRRYGYIITVESAADLTDAELSDKADAFLRYLDI